MDHVISAGETEDVEVHSKLLDWTWTLGELFQQPENEIVNTAIKNIRTKIVGKFDADTFLCKLNTLVKETPLKHWTFTLPGVMIASALIFILIGLCCWKK
jgi:hypothetical protein